MPDVNVAVLTQALRADACCAFIAQADATPFVVFTGDPGAFTALAIPHGTQVRSTSQAGVLLDPARVARVGRRRLLGWMRSGSTLGRAAERWARRVLATLARPELAAASVATTDMPVNEYLAGELQRLHHESPISRIVVFDVFDLPTVLSVAEPHGIVVMVR